MSHCAGELFGGISVKALAPVLSGGRSFSLEGGGVSDVEEKGSQVAPDKVWRCCVGAQCWGASIHSLNVDFEDTMEFSRIFESKSYKSTIDTESCSQMKLTRYEDTIKRLTNETEQGMCKRCEFATIP